MTMCTLLFVLLHFYLLHNYNVYLVEIIFLGPWSLYILYCIILEMILYVYKPICNAGDDFVTFSDEHVC